MKTLIGFSILIIFLICLSFVNLGSAQEYSDEEICTFTEEEQEEIESTVQLGGRDITAEGTVRALMLFIDFSDDTVDINNSAWPVGDGPSFLDDIIHSEEGGEVQQHNITSFLADNSFDQFIMVGEAIYRQAPRSIDEYLNDTTTASNVAHWATKEVLIELDQEMDFSDYDNWHKIADYQHEEEPDSLIDMIFVVFRRWYKDENDDPIPGFWAFGWASMPADTGKNNTLYIDEGERRINFYQSGVTSLAGYPQQWAFEICLHEFGHKWGLPHNYNDGMWTLMSYWQHTPSPFMNSYERERLGWITYVTITENTNAVIPDYGTSATPYRIQIDSDEYFLVENHQEESPFDVVNWYDSTLTLTHSGPGLYILRLNNSLIEQKVKVVCADGNWNWDNPYWILNPFGTQEPGDSVPVYDRLDPNPINGLSDKDLIPHTKNGTERVVAWLDDATGAEKQAIRYKGIGLSMWLPDASNVFSPWSNPPTTKANGTSTTIGIEVKAYNPSTGNITADFYTDDPEDAPPARILDLSIFSAEDHPQLRWSANTEPDLSYYYIYRKVDDGEWENIVHFEPPDTTYIDYEIEIGGSGQGFIVASYMVKAMDSEEKFSNPSNIATTLGVWSDEGEDSKPFAQSDNVLLPRKTELYQNYPNPFNPTTSIRFGLPEESKVVITVYSITGEYVATLLNSKMTEGYHQVIFDASELASGIYLYRIQAGDFTQVRKMMLIK